jgi:uncharacterized protein (TIGR03000 family)
MWRRRCPSACRGRDDSSFLGASKISMRRIRFFAVAAAIAVMVGQPQMVLAQGSSGGSSGGYSASSVSYGSGGGRVGPLRRLMSKIRDHRSARFASASYSGGSSGGSTGASYVSSGSSGGASYASGGSSGGASYTSGGSSGASYASSGSSGGASYASGSSGGASYASGGSNGSALSASYASTSYASSGGYASSSVSYDVPVNTVSMGSTSAVYESPVVSSSYDSGISYEGSYPASSSETIIDDTIISDGSSMIDAIPMDSFESSRYESARPSTESDEAILNVIVPEGAVVTVNDHETESEGETRKFMSRGLKKGYVYTYVVKATFDRDGEPKTETKSIKLRPGDVELVSFHDSNLVKDPVDLIVKSTKSDEKLIAKSTIEESKDVVTIVRLTVPPTAEVTLAGNPTAGGGRIRTFRTKQLKAGQKWTDYTVAVTVVIDGTPVTKTKTIDVDAGTTNEIVFEFDDNTLASR